MTPDRIAVDQSEYEYAVELWPGSIMGLVRNANIVPNWIADGDRFWFKDDDADGHHFKLVDATSGMVEAAFDHAAVVEALSRHGVDVDANALPVINVEFGPDDIIVAVSTPGGELRVNVRQGTIQPARRPAATELPAPDGTTLFLRDHNLWLRDVGGDERSLTDDGEQFYAWGAGVDFNLRKVATNRGEAVPLPTSVFWSADSRTIFVHRPDERALEPYPYIEYVPADGSLRPKVHYIRNQMVGEAPRGGEFVFIDVATRARVIAEDREDLTLRPDAGGVWWNADGQFLYTLAMNFDATRAAFVEIGLHDGRMRVVYEERSATFFDFNTYPYNQANVRLRDDGSEVIWYSQRDGWGHLYAIDIANGAVRQLTQGEWAVGDIVCVTPTQVFFTAGGREPGRNPYYRHLYRVDIDGTGPNAGLKLLTPDDADHGFPGTPTPAIARILNRPTGQSQISPTGRYFVDAVSRVDCPTRYQVRNADGGLITEFARLDASTLTATGWTPPEMFSAKAADGETDLFGVLVKPRNFDPAINYPVIEHIYGGPQIIAQPRTFLEGINGAFLYGINTLADFGFVVAIMDGPGTPYRSKSFHDMTYGQTDRWGIAHHRAAIEGAAATRTWMDLSRVGVRGHSFGGYGTAAAMLIEPTFYKVGVSSAGMYDVGWAQAGMEGHFGRPDYGDGRHLKNRPNEVAANHLAMSPSHLAGALRGQLMLVVGDLDENIQPAGLFHFANALIAEGKTFDLLMMPGRNHGFSADAYFHKRTWDYFIEHLQGRAPLIHFMPSMKSGVRMFI